MPVRGAFKPPNMPRRLDSLRTSMMLNEKRPSIGLTQGGSSRRDGGAKPAATNGLFKPKKPKRTS